MLPQPPTNELDHEQQPDKPAAHQQFKQIKISQKEGMRLQERIYHDFLAARSDHDNRINRFRRYFRMWRGLNQTKGTRQEGQDLQVPMLKWTVFGAWAKIMQALLGDDAEIVGKPTAPSDGADASKVGHYMTWRFFEYMQAIPQLAAWAFRCVLFGRAFAEVIYEQEYYWERDEDGADSEVLAYDGPRLRALWPSQLIVPSQDNVNTPDDFEWIIRRDRITPQQLLDGEWRDKFQGVTENWDKITASASQRQERDYWWDDEKVDSDEAEGVDHTNTLGNRDSVEIWRWYGKWRLPTSNRDTRPDNIRYREVNQSELLVSYLPKVNLIVGVQDRRDLYPRMRKRNPFIDLSTVKDGSFWSPGLGELLEDIQNEMSINHALFRKAGMLSVGPIIFFNPASGWDPDTFEYSPGVAVPTANPADVKVVTLTANLEYAQVMNQTLKGIAELVSGVTDQSLGRSSDRPNAPQTASGQAMLLNEGNIRVSLDMSMLREDLSAALNYIWLLDSEYADEKVFFRVTEDDPQFDVNKGFGTMTAEDRLHPYSFDLKFATSLWSREAKKQHLLQLYGLSLQNPIVAQNPRALWVILNRVWEAFGEDSFREILPEPPSLEQPMMPKQEWVEMMKGDVVQVSPLDDDTQHILDHRRRLEQEINEPPERQDKELQQIAFKHIAQHETQIRQKQILQALAQRAVAALQQQNGGMAPPAAGGIEPGPSAPAPSNGAPQLPAGPAPGFTGQVQPPDQMMPQ